ncbi:MAG: choice-of-anchor J domain-containing protein, partial [Ignavibacteria bacterium]|nr:choice-of-anchor J domain-containing protein [Ignavibacteria bacterium]
MKFFKNLIASFTLLLIGTLCAAKAEQTVFFQENFSNGIGNWKTVDVDGKVVHSEMLQTLNSIGITLPNNKMSWVVGKVSSNPDQYMALSTSYYNPAGRADDWLISPKITIGENAYLEWSAIAFSSSYPDA